MTRLMFKDKQLDNYKDKTLTSQRGCTIEVLSKITGGIDFYVVGPDLLSPSYDYDFTNLHDNGATFIRGMELYKRPYGWERIALNVVGRYGSNEAWLGSVGTSPHEWPVSYHGTRVEFAESIAGEGYQLSRGVRFEYGVGIYSTPEIDIAEGFATQFERYNARWKVVFQNRVIPVRLSKHRNNTYWLAPNDEDIRPYGLCVKRIGDL